MDLVSSFIQIFPSDINLFTLLLFLLGLIILWVIVSIPVWIAAKAVTGGKASIGSSMAATVLGPIVYALVLIVSSFFLSALIGAFSGILALILAFLAWLYIYKSIFKTGWLGAIGIAILAVIVFIIISIIISILFAFTIPIGFF